MRLRLSIALVAIAALVLPVAASAHAYLVRTEPSASGITARAPADVRLTFSEAVEPRFAIVSVTDASGQQLVDRAPARSPNDPNTLVIPIEHVPEGWYLVYWRDLVDGHPVRGAYTFQVGPSPGPGPSSRCRRSPRRPRRRASSAPCSLVFLAVMSAYVFALRIAIARPLVRRVPGAGLRSLNWAVGIASGVALVAIPYYLLRATAEFALRPWTDVGALLPLIRDSAFGRGFVDLEICFALFVLAAGVALWFYRPEAQQGRLPSCSRPGAR